MSDFELVAQQLDANKNRLETALAKLRRPEHATDSAEVETIESKAAPSPQEPPLIEHVLKLVVLKLENVLTEEEREWFSANLLGTPGFLASSSGRSITRLVFEEFRSWMSK